MKNLKTLLLCMALIVSSSIFAQMNFGIKGGVNFANINNKINGDTNDNTKMKLGYNIGGVGNYSFTDIFSLESGLIIESKGFEYRLDNDKKYSNNADYGKVVMNVMYLDIPINLKAKIDLGGVQIFGQFGPYVGFALTGKMKLTGDLEKDMADAGLDTEDSIEFGGSAKDDNLTRTDFGLMFGAGIGFNMIELGAVYDLGLANIQPGGDSDNYVKNGVFKISIAYMFGN